jgi:hypothetical protein
VPRTASACCPLTVDIASDSSSARVLQTILDGCILIFLGLLALWERDAACELLSASAAAAGTE